MVLLSGHTHTCVVDRRTEAMLGSSGQGGELHGRRQTPPRNHMKVTQGECDKCYR